MSQKMSESDVAAVFAEPISQRLLGSSIPARFAYTGLDGHPPVIPIAYLWDGERLIVCTVPKSAKVAALRRNPRVAVTIDTEGNPPNVLLIRGSATVEPVDGVREEYVSASIVPPDQQEGWAARHPAPLPADDQDHDRAGLDEAAGLRETIPKAVEDLVKAYGDPR